MKKNKNTKKRNCTIFFTIVSLFILFNLIFFFVGPEKIVQFVGVENTYLLIFLIATIGGLSTFTGAFLFGSIATFAAGGAVPILLGIFGGLGIFVSDSIFYFLAFYGKKAIPEKWDSEIKKIEYWVEKRPSWLVLFLIYIYIGFTPLPNDVLMIILAISGYTYKKIVITLLLGSLTIATITACFGSVWFLFS